MGSSEFWFSRQCACIFFFSVNKYDDVTVKNTHLMVQKHNKNGARFKTVKYFAWILLKKNNLSQNNLSV